MSAAFRLGVYFMHFRWHLRLTTSSREDIDGRSAGIASARKASLAQGGKRLGGPE
jgi:hypothetical protein